MYLVYFVFVAVVHAPFVNMNTKREQSISGLEPQMLEKYFIALYCIIYCKPRLILNKTG